MNGRLAYFARRAAREARDLSVALLAVSFYGLILLVPRRALIEGVARLAEIIGMRVTKYRNRGLYNLAVAFPEKTEAERVDILRRAWGNLGRTAAEYFFIDRIWDFDPNSPGTGHIEVEGIENFVKLVEDGKPGIVVSAHLANWELPMVAAAHHGLDAVALYMQPRNRWIARMVRNRRAGNMGGLIVAETGALHRLSRALDEGRHVGLLVDQFQDHGPQILFFGRATLANPVFARLARHFDCPVHAVRVVRLPEGQFRVVMTDEIALPRDASGAIDVAGAAQTIATLVESWIREYPDQWLWLHRRFR